MIKAKAYKPQFATDSKLIEDVQNSTNKYCQYLKIDYSHRKLMCEIKEGSVGDHVARIICACDTMGGCAYKTNDK